MRTVHKLKLWPVYYDAVSKGLKTFEVRSNYDRCFQKGDAVILQEYDPTPDEKGQPKGYVNSPDLVNEIGYVMPIDAERVVFSLIPRAPDFADVNPF